MKDLKTIILAAGEGTRMKSKKPKVLHKIFDKSMIKYVIDTAKKSNSDEICVVIGHKSDEVREEIEKENIKIAVQNERKGTGHAVMQAMDFIEDDKDILILYGDTPLITSDTLNNLLDCHRKNSEIGVSFISAIVDNPSGYGRIIRDKDNNFLKIVEDKDANDEEKAIKEINTGIYLFKGKDLRYALNNLKNDNIQSEYYLTDCLELILKSGKKVSSTVVDGINEFLGVNSREQLADATQKLQERINKKHIENGVTIIDTKNTYISSDAEIGMDTIIYPGCVIEGKTVIGENCSIGPNSQITNMIIHDNVKFQSSTGIDSEIGSNTNVGPYAYIRPNSTIGENVKIGDFVEVKNSVIGDKTKVSHLTYIGDADVGKRINFGCGTVIVNYDGKKKHRTIIEDDVFIGCNTNLVAPVTVKKGSYIAAGSTITKNVPEDVLAIARARQQIIEGLTKK